MRKTVSADYDVFAVAAGKTVHWKVSVKKVAVLDEAQSAGTWIDVTDHLDNTMPDKISESIELLMGQFATTVLSFKGLDIAWWNANIFNATQYLELKVEFWINDLTADTITPFGGWIDKKKDGKWCVKSDEATDTVVFSVAGYLEYAARTSAVAITTQILNNDTDGAGLVGLRMEKLIGLYLTNANVTSYPLKKGIHSIQLSYTAGTPNVWTASLDGGTEVTLPTSDGLITLGNGNGTVGDVNEFDTQKVTLYVVVAELQPLIASVSQGIIQKVLHDVLPRTWFNHVWVFRLLQLMFKQIGTTDYTFDNFRMATYDGRRVPSFWDVPPGDSYYDKPSAIACDNTNNLLWIGIKDRIYKHDMTTHVYTLVGTVPSGYVVVKLWGEDSASGFIWGVARDSSGAHKIIKIVTATSTLTTYTTTRTTTTVGGEANFALDLTVRGIYYLSDLFPTTGPTTNIFLLNTLTEVSHYSAGYGVQDAPAFSDGNNNYYYQLSYISDIMKVTFDGAVFHYTTITTGWTYAITHAVYSIALGLWVGCWYNGSLHYWAMIYWNPITNVTTSFATADTEAVGMVSDETNGCVYWTYKLNWWDFGRQTPHKLNVGGHTTAGELFVAGFTVDETLFSNQVCYDGVNDRIIGILEPLGLLFEFGTKVSMYINGEADYSGMTIYDALKEMFGFNLMPRISGQKKAFVYRRFDDDGLPVTTGNTVTLNRDNSKNVSEDTGYGDAYDVVTVDNGVNSVSCDADGFDAVAMGDDKELPVSCRFIADNLLKDFAFWYYNYWKTSKDRIQVPTPLIPYFQFEPFDAAYLVYPGKLYNGETGVIVGQGMSRDGTTEFEVVYE